MCSLDPRSMQLTACALVCRVVRRVALPAAAAALSLTLLPGGAAGAVGGSRRSGMCLFPAGAPGCPRRDVRPCACGHLRLRGGLEGDPGLGRNGGGERAQRRPTGCWSQDGNGTNAINGGTGVSEREREGEREREREKERARARDRDIYMCVCACVRVCVCWSSRWQALVAAQTWSSASLCSHNRSGSTHGRLDPSCHTWPP